MRQPGRSRPLVAGVLVLAMVVSLTGMLVAAGTSIRIASPSSGARVSGIISIQASVRTDERVSYVILGIDQDRPQSSNSAPYTFEMDTRELTDGPHRIFVEAYDRYGLVGSSSVVTIYVKNGSSSAMQVKKQPATQVATAKPPAPSVKTAKAPSGPPVRAAASSAAGARTTASPADVEAAAAVAPMMSGRGPVPAPTHAAADTTIAATRPGTASAPARPGVASGPVGSAPPMPQIASASPRGTTRSHTVVLNGQAVEFDVAPRIVDGRMHVAFRSMFENEGSKVTWDARSKTAMSVKGALEVQVPIGTRIARVNGRDVDMGVAASITKGRTIIPVRFFGQTVGANVSWDAATQTAMLRTAERTIAERLPEG